MTLLVETVNQRPVQQLSGSESSLLPKYTLPLGLVMLFPVEVIAVTLSLAPGQGVGDGTWWSDAVRLSTRVPALALRFVLPSALCGVVLAAVLGRLSLQAFAERTLRARLPMLVLHLSSLVIFVVLTWQIAAGACLTSAVPGMIVIAWVGVGVLLLVSWLAALLPLARWQGLVGPMTAALLVGALTNVVAITSGGASGQLWLSFHRATFWTAHAILSTFFASTVCDPERFVLGTEGFQVHIDTPCSGYEGIGLMTVFLGGYLFLFRRQLRFPHVLVLLPLGVGLIWLLNAARIAGLIALGAQVSPEVAVEGFHSQAGWLAFNVVGLGLVALSHSWGFCYRHGGEFERADGSVNPAAPYLVPFVVLMASLLVCAAFSAGFDYLYPVRVVAVGLAVLWYGREYTRWNWSCSWHAIGVGIVVFVLWLALELIQPVVSDVGAFGGALENMPGGMAVAWIVVRALGSIVTVPMAEELAFRGYLLRRLQGREFLAVRSGSFTWLSFVVSSVLFGALHQRWLAGTVAGMMYAWVLYRRGKISDAVWAHATTNALLAAYVIGTGSWGLWA